MATRTGSPEELEVASWALDRHHNKPQFEKEIAASRKQMDL